MVAHCLKCIILILAYCSHHVVVQAQFINLADNVDYTKPIELSSNMTVDWSIHFDLHTRYCGPKTVGGYDIAKKYCSPQTACSVSGTTQGTFGTNGNDCSSREYIDLEGGYKGKFMCFTDIRCISPSNRPSDTPTVMPSKSYVPSSTPSIAKSDSPSMSIMPTINNSTSSPTNSPSMSPNDLPTVSPTGSPVETSFIKIRGFFCGSSYEMALKECDPSRSCSSNSHCNAGESCYPNISCEFVASKANGLGDHHVASTGDVGPSDSNSDVGDVGPSAFSNSDVSSGFVCGVRKTLVSFSLFITLLWMF